MFQVCFTAMSQDEEDAQPAVLSSVYLPQPALLLRALPQSPKEGYRVGPVSPVLTSVLSPDTVLTGSLCLMSFIPNFQERTSKSSKYEVIIKLLLSAKVPTVVGSDLCTVIPMSFCCVLLFLQVDIIMLAFSILRVGAVRPSCCRLGSETVRVPAC